MQSFYAAVKSVINIWLIDLRSIVVTAAILGVLGTLAAEYNWPSQFWYSILGTMALGGTVGLAIYLFKRNRRYSLLYPTEPIEYLGVVSLILFAAAASIDLGAFFERIFD